MDKGLIVLFLYLVATIGISIIFGWRKNIKSVFFGVLSGRVNDAKNSNYKTSYSIRNFHEKGKYKSIIRNIKYSMQIVFWGDSLVPIGIKCGDGGLAIEYNDDQKKDIKNGNLINENDIILINFNEGIKSRRFISFLDLSQIDFSQSNEIYEIIKEKTPKDKGLNECERVNEQTIEDLILRIKKEQKEILKNFNINSEEYERYMSNYMLSITYHNENNQYFARYSVHNIEKLRGKVVKIIPNEYIDSSEIIEDFNSYKKDVA